MRSHGAPTGGGEESPQQLFVCGDVFDIWDNVDKSSHHWRDPVET